MTPPASTICCAGCGYLAGLADPYPFRCPRNGTDDADHVLTRVLSLDGARFPAGPEANPFLRYRALMHSWHGARATPFFRSPELSEALAFSAAGGVWVKDETPNVSGSHKGRHLMGVLIHLAVMERCGLLDPARRRELAIASCGNAALAAAVLARAGGWGLTVFVPPEADARVVRRLDDLGATVVTCPREPGLLGDPAYLRLAQELARGALPFTTQGPENGLAI